MWTVETNIIDGSTGLLPVSVSFVGWEFAQVFVLLSRRTVLGEGRNIWES